jgi:hypothetical protein
MNHLPPTEPGTVLRILATSDLGATFVPMPTSFGESGTCAGIVELLEREIERQPTIWLDAGDLVVGSPMHPLHGIRPWEEVAGLPIAVAAAGNHEFDDGLPALQEAAGLLGFPVLCANADVGLPASAMVDSAAGPFGVIGLTNPRIGEYSLGPKTDQGWPERVGALARELRSRGARWVVALLHDGVEWWPNAGPGGPPNLTRSDRLDAAARPWARWGRGSGRGSCLPRKPPPTTSTGPRCPRPMRPAQSTRRSSTAAGLARRTERSATAPSRHGRRPGVLPQGNAPGKVRSLRRARTANRWSATKTRSRCPGRAEASRPWRCTLARAWAWPTTSGRRGA